jgi:16S rRNA (uracil1498-N3)-methyltransferase
MIEKATELGVAEIVPVIATRTERGLDRAAEKRAERWRRIGMEASQQSRRAHLPEIGNAVPFAKGITQQGNYRYVLDEEGGTPLLASLPVERRPTDSVALLVGPEGGWTDAEREQFRTMGWAPVTMGNLILRAETAAMASIAIVSGAWLAA